MSTRFSKARVSLALGMLALVGLVACCTNFTRRVEFSLSSHSGRTTLALSVAKLGPHFNPHGDNSDEYTFVFPRGLTHIKASQLSEYSVNYKAAPPAFSESSEIDLKVDSGGCEIAVRLFSTDGRAVPFNGVHRMRYCGEEDL
jgi:hypothetical protein